MTPLPRRIGRLCTFTKECEERKAASKSHRRPPFPSLHLIIIIIRLPPSLKAFALIRLLPYFRLLPTADDGYIAKSPICIFILFPRWTYLSPFDSLPGFYLHRNPLDLHPADGDVFNYTSDPHLPLATTPAVRRALFYPSLKLIASGRLAPSLDSAAAIRSCAIKPRP